MNRNISSGKSVYLLRELHVLVNPQGCDLGQEGFLGACVGHSEQT